MAKSKVKLYKLPWHTQFTWGDDPRTFTLERGDGLFMWVAWTDDAGERHTGQMYIGEKVTPL